MNSTILKTARWAAAWCAAIVFALAAHAEPSLPALNIDLSQTTVSGISSGAFMAVQFGVAHSASVRGVAATAGGPYFCAGKDSLGGAAVGKVIARCMQGDPALSAQRITAADLAQMRAAARAWSAQGRIDDVAHLATQTVWLFHGYNDGIVKAPVSDALFKWYQGMVPSGNVFYKDQLRAAHAQISASCGEAAQNCQTCATSGGDFINACTDGAANALLYDAAGSALQMFYGAMTRTPTTQLSGTLKRFDQQPYVRDENGLVQPLKVAMANAGFLFVPRSCAAGAACRVHIAFHGCGQQIDKIGDAFARKAGFNEWADANHIVVLYPQARDTHVPVGLPINPDGCWDWWGYNDFLFESAGHYATRDGRQISAVWNMVTALSHGATETGAANATAAEIAVLKLVDVSARQAALVWSPVAGAAAYRIERDGQPAGVQTAPLTLWADGGLAPVTNYRYVVRPLDAQGHAGGASNEVIATTAARAPRCDPYFSFSKGKPVTRKNMVTTKTCP